MANRTERDSLGEVSVPASALYGAQTQRAVDNFTFSARRMPPRFIQALAMIKASAAAANRELGLLEPDLADQVIRHAMDIASGKHSDHFPVEVFQTGSGTSTNMNMNEVIARLCGDPVHPNDHVNMSQSSNDVIPSAIQVSVCLELTRELEPALAALCDSIRGRADELDDTVKTGRTHLMDAMPITLGQELRTWAYQVDEGLARCNDLRPRLAALPLGGTAVGTGVNCPPGYPSIALRELSEMTGATFTEAESRFTRMASQDVALECSSVLKGIAVSLMKIANDLRWMSSGPLAGLAEIELKALQPGSSIMPGKVNPVIPEAVAMIGAEVIGNDAAVTIAAQSGNFQLNVMLPLVAEKLLVSTSLLAGGARALAETIQSLQVNEENLSRVLGRNPILVTALNRRIGYEAAAAIAKRAYREGRDVIDVAAEDTDIPRDELEALLDPIGLAHPERND